MVWWITRHMYGALLIATWAEGLGLPLPAEFLYGAAGVGVKAGALRFPLIVLIGTLGNVAGSLTSYTVAYWGGQAALRRLKTVGNVAEGAEERAQAIFRRYGPLAVTICRFVGVIRAATILSAGVARMPLWRFLPFLALGAFSWNLLWAAVGYIVGHNIGPIMRRAAKWMLVLFVVAVIVVLVRMVVRWWKRRNA